MHTDKEKLLGKINGVSEIVSYKLKREGFDSIMALARTDPETLVEACDLSLQQAKGIINAAKNVIGAAYDELEMTSEQRNEGNQRGSKVEREVTEMKKESGRVTTENGKRPKKFRG
ncbi:MAG: hypothetical protein IIA45_11935 [Bacteroidetes bacterium]|nr:hypothetical protein [Bacteroidota bacterium]